MIVKQAKLSSKGQVTIPLEVRRALSLCEGDIITFEVDTQGQARLMTDSKVGAFANYAGILSEGKGLSAKDIVKDVKTQRGWLYSDL